MKYGYACNKNDNVEHSKKNSNRQETSGLDIARMKNDEDYKFSNKTTRAKGTFSLLQKKKKSGKTKEARDQSETENMTFEP